MTKTRHVNQKVCKSEQIEKTELDIITNITLLPLNILKAGEIFSHKDNILISKTDNRLATQLFVMLIF